MAGQEGLHAMSKWTEATALAMVLSNTRRKKRPNDLVTTADAMAFLIDLYGSQKALAQKLDLSVEMVRQFLTVLKLPTTVKALFARRQIDSVDIAKELAALPDDEDQERAAKAVMNSPSKDVRDIKRLIKSGDYDVADAKRTVLDAKPDGLNIFLVDFDDATLRQLESEARTGKMKPAELVRTIVTDWLKARRRKQD